MTSTVVALAERVAVLFKQVGSWNSANTNVSMVSFPALDAFEAAQFLITFLLPFGDQLSIG